MRQTDLKKWLAVLIACSMVSLPTLPAGAQVGGPTATLSGTVRQAPDGAPLKGARLLLAGRAGGGVIPSEPFSAAGAFSMRGLNPGAYDVAVDLGSGVYPLATPLYLGPATTRVVRIEVGPNTSPEQGAPSAPAKTAGKGSRFWNNPFTASLIVLGAAVVVSVLVQSATDETIGSSIEPPATPTD